MKTSEQIDKILPALLKVKENLLGVGKDAKNPYFKSNYATLNAHLEVIEPLLKANGLVLFQPVTALAQGFTVVESLVYHTSGQFVSSSVELGAYTDVQKKMSEITYSRRYTLSALLGMVAVDDDDGNKASGRGDEFKKASILSRKEVVDVVAKIDAKDIVENGMKEVNESIGAPEVNKEKRSFRQPKKPVVDNDDI